ncbi:DUF3253 domain-containing protein [Ohtaekwangia sp.]|jgi:hypothetical protein|uniref:DUF3253 domain-containing protein n=1 Tax=Ohtaekwangia sp. TaxID=2066019 RepID=UPI002F9578D6
MVFADDIRKVILKLAEERGTEKTFDPSDVARAIDQQNWSLLIDQVELVANTLIREGKIIALQSGRVIDIKNYKGPVQFRKNVHA